MKDSDLTSRVTRVEGQIESLTGLTTRLAHSTEILSDRVGQLGRPNISTMLSGGALLCSAIVGLYAFTVLRIQTAIAPLESRAEVSIRDRQEIRESMERIQEQLNAVDARDQAGSARVGSDLKEIETQFAKDNEIRNVQFANNLRWTALIWQRLYGERFPSEIQFYPTVPPPTK
jgi:hypothetical protein